MYAVARRHNLPKTTRHMCLKRYNLYPYWPQQVHAFGLETGDNNTVHIYKYNSKSYKDFTSGKQRVQIK
jgi:hypothetical protein